MIRINLARKRAPGGGGLDLKNLSIASIFAFLKSRGGEDEDGQPKKFDANSPLVKIAIGVVAIYYLDDYLASERAAALRIVDAQIAEIEKERDGYLKKLGKIKGFEPIKKQLEEDEKAIRTKLEVVTRLVENRNLPAKMLMQIAQVIPQEVWVTQIATNSDSVKFVGGTPGHAQVSDFIKALSGTAYFSEVQLRGIQESTSANKDQKYQSFELDARRK